MPRRGRIINRAVNPDAKYQNDTVARLINRMMSRGKKSTAERVVYKALQIMEEQEHKSPVTLLELAVKNATPLLQVKPRRVGGATYQVPIEIDPARGNALAIKWFIKASRDRSGRTMAEKLAAGEFSGTERIALSAKKSLVNEAGWPTV